MLSTLFQNCHRIFNAEIFPEQGDSVMCSLHDCFDDQAGGDHNCLGCNFADTTVWIQMYLSRASNLGEIDEAYTFYLMRLYLFVERAYVIFDIIKLPEEYRARHFTVFRDIHKWANFTKHPNAFILAHHPTYTFDGDASFDRTQFSLVIDQAFVNEHYSSSKHNKKLWDSLQNKKDIAVMFPSPESLTREFCAAAKKFIGVVRDNSVFREILASRSTYANYYLQSEIVDS
jgi:hypothetical protein